MARLPIPGSDDGTWGSVLNSFLSISHNSDGSIKSEAVSLTKSDIGLSNVDNTSDVNKPVSNAMQTALNNKADTAALATVATSGSYTDLSSTPSLSPVASSGQFSDLSGTTTLAQLPSGATFSVVWDTTNSVWEDSNGTTIIARPSARTDITMIAKGGASAPAFGVNGDIWLKDNTL